MPVVIDLIKGPLLHKHGGSSTTTYNDTAAVLADIPLPERYDGLTVKIGLVEYWFLADLVTLVPKGGGGITGPDFGTDNIIALFDGATGKLLKMSNVTIDAAGQMKINAAGIGLQSISDYVAIEAIANGPDSFALAGQSDHVPLQLANTDAAPTGNKIVVVLRGDSAHLVPQNGYGLKEQFRLPVLGWDPAHPELSEIPGGEFICQLTDNTQNLEKSIYEWWLQKSGTLTKAMSLDGSGNLVTPGTMNGYRHLVLTQAEYDLIAVPDPTTIYYIK